MSVATALRAALVAALAALFLFPGAVPASAGQTPGTYSYWNFTGTTGLSDVVYPLTVEQHPGQQSQVYWSNQVSWANGTGGYAGMQTNGRSDSNLFLFSVWNATETKLGTTGSFCQKFGGEGEGMTCRIWQKWTAGQTYRFHYKAEGSGWWGMTITNATTGASFKLGSIRVGSDLLKPSSQSWVEYYRWSDSRSSCQTEPYSRARFDAPTGNNGTLTAKLGSTSTNACPGFPSGGATSVAAGTGVRHTLGIGNSVMGPITGAASRCLDIVSGNDIAIKTCDGDGSQAWVLSQDGSVRNKNFTCLDVYNRATADGSKVGVWACNGGSNQKWNVLNGTLVNPSSGKCLDTQGGATADGTTLIIRTCSTASTQKWTTPARPAS